MNKNTNKQTRIVKRRKRKIRRRVYFILMPLLIIFLALAGYAAYLYLQADSALSDSYTEIDREKSDLRDTAVDPSEDHVSILLMGVDARDMSNDAENSRTDTLMVATLNVEEKSVKLVSIPRDTYVYIPEVGYETKINHAHAYGGTEATIETVEEFLEVPIDYYAKVNFDAFVDVVNAIDGVTVEVPYEFTEQNSDDEAGAIHLMPGEQQLDGEEALALARTRKLDNDIERGKRQQEIIKAVIDKAASAGSVLKYDDIIQAVGDNMTTNMTFKEMQSFIGYATKGTNLDIETLTVEGYDSQPGSTYYWMPDETALEELQTTLQEHLGIEDPI